MDDIYWVSFIYLYIYIYFGSSGLIVFSLTFNYDSQIEFLNLFLLSYLGSFVFISVSKYGLKTTKPSYETEEIFIRNDPLILETRKRHFD